MTESTTSEVLLSRSIRGGFAGGVRSTCTVDRDGRCEIDVEGVRRSGLLEPGQVDLLGRICAATDFADLPERLDLPVTRSDADTSTYQVGAHRVSVRDADGVGDSLPPALHVLDAVISAITRDAA